MALTPVPDIEPTLPPAPDPADDEVEFDADSYAFTSALPGFGNDVKAIGDATYQNALYAQERASASASSATEASGYADAAGASASASVSSATDASGYAVQASGFADASASSANEASGYAVQASGYADAAASSATDADTSAADAGASASAASEWAIKMGGPVSGGEYSAKYWAAQAADIVSDGVIQDETTSTITTWSSAKLLSEFGTLATQAEMEAGTESARRAMSPLLVAQAIAALGKQNIVRSGRTSNSELVASDFGKLIDITSGTFTQTFSAAATLGNGWWLYIRNSGVGDVTLDPSGSETIDGLGSFVMYPGEARLVQCDGAALHTIVLNGFYKTFTASGTFVKPPGYSAFRGLLWAGGGSGGASIVATSYCGGGGGGACVPLDVASSVLAASESVTIGAGGAAVSQGKAGLSGGNSSLGAIVTSYSGAGGGYATSQNTAYGGGGGGVLSAGLHGTGGSPTTTGFGGGNGGIGSSSSVYGGGGGAQQQSSTSVAGGESLYGGGGGGNGGGGAGGVSTFGGSGGAGGNPSGVAGEAPGGGGGSARGSTSATSGAGARGELRIWGVI